MIVLDFMIRGTIVIFALIGILHTAMVFVSPEYHKMISDFYKRRDR